VQTIGRLKCGRNGIQKRALMSAAEGNHFPQGNQYSLPGQHCWRAARSRNKPAGTHRGDQTPWSSSSAIAPQFWRRLLPVCVSGPRFIGRRGNGGPPGRTGVAQPSQLIRANGSNGILTGRRFKARLYSQYTSTDRESTMNNHKAAIRAGMGPVWGQTPGSGK